MFQNRTSTLIAGDRAPDFSLKTVHGEVTSGADLEGGVAMLVFFRGTW